MQKIGDKRRFHIYVVFTMSLLCLNYKKPLIALLFEIFLVTDQIHVLLLHVTNAAIRNSLSAAGENRQNPTYPLAKEKMIGRVRQSCLDS